MRILNLSETKMNKELYKREVHLIYVEGDVESSVIVLAFPKKWTRKMQKYWLCYAGYPTETTYYHVSSMYDCTGECHAKYVDYRKNRVTITSYYDV